MEVQPVSAIRFPPRSSSYRAFSIIDAYGGDPGIQFSPVEEDIPTKEPYPTLLNSVRKLRTEDPLSGYYSFDVDETYGSSYGSDPERLTMTTMDEYDPYRQDLPVHTSRSKVGTPVPKAETPGEKVERSRADSGLAKDTVKKHVKTLPSRPNEGLLKGKKTPPAPEKDLPPPPMPQETLEKGQNGQPALKTALRLETPFKDSPTTSPVSRTTKELPAIEKPLPNPSLQLQRRLTDDEGTPFPPRTISRSFKPPSLHLKTSNGSTAASIISSSSSVSLPSTLAAGSTSSNPTPKSSLQQLHKRTPSQLSKELLPTTTYSPHDRPLPLLPQNKQQLQSLIHPALGDSPLSTYNNFASPLDVVPSDGSPALADDEANMKRLRNLVIKRKPIKAEDLVVEKDQGNLPRVTSPASSNDLLRNKDKRAMFSSPSLPTIIGDRNPDNRQSATMVSPSKQRPSIREIAQPPNDSAQNISQESVFKSPSEGPSVESSEEGTVIVKIEDSRSNSPPTLLPPPVQVLEESPSKWGLRKKSEKNLRKAVPERSNANDSSMISKGNAHDLFTSAAVRLQAHFALVHSTPQDPVVSENIVIENEAEWVHTNHMSTLDLTRPRPIDTNAPKLSTVQLHCHIDHKEWHPSSNDVHPVDCALCYQSPSTSILWTCAFCALRVCLLCKGRIEKAHANTKLSKQIEAVRDEAARQLRDYRAQKGETERGERASRQAEASRPPSPVGSVYYDYPGVPQEPPMSAADFRPRSPGAMSMRSIRSVGTMRPRGRAPPPRGPIPNFGPPGQRRFSDSRNHPPPTDYPPIPRMPTAFRDEYDTGSPMRPPRGRSRPRGPLPARHLDPMVDINYGLGGDQGRMPTGIAGGGMPMPRSRPKGPYEVY